MLDTFFYKINLFHPTISNVLSLFFLSLSFGFKVNFIKSYKDYFYYWYLRPIFTFLFSALLRLFLEFNFSPSVADFDQYPVFLQILFLYLVVDFFIYIAHFCMHNNRYLFKLHKIHHQIEHLSWENGSKDTVWFELIVVSISVLVSFWLNIEFLITAITICLWKLALAYTHFQKPINFKWLEFIIISPEKHELHHTQTNRNHYNYSLTLPLWDYLYYKIKKNIKG